MDEDRTRYPDREGLPPDLLETAQRYAAQPVPHPTREQTRQLVERLLAEQAQILAGSAARPRSAFAAVRVARWRVRLVSAWFWIVSVVLLALVASITAVNTMPDKMVPLVLLLPLTAVLGLAQAARTPSRGLRDVETTCPVGTVTVMAASALAVVCLVCAFGLIATAFLALLSWAPFAALLVAWLGPLLLLAALSLPVALRWGAIPAAAIGAGPWLALALAAVVIPGSSAGEIFALPHDALSFAWHLGAAALGATTLLLLLRDAAWQRALIRPAS
jgi:hypothetical protein